jgi:hypothetical protein
MRIAETRAVNRALRKAYGIGLCSVEELGSLSNNRGLASDHAPATNHSTNGSNNGNPVCGINSVCSSANTISIHSG